MLCRRGSNSQETIGVERETDKEQCPYPVRGKGAKRGVVKLRSGAGGRKEDCRTLFGGGGGRVRGG